MNKRYGDDSLVSFGAAQNIRTEEQALSDIETGKAQVLEGEDIVMPNVPSMGNEPIVQDTASISGPGMSTPLNQDQRAALASGDIDAAIALRGQRG
jgi:hypothetical protein